MPLQWMICLLHTNELLLRHLMNYLNGKTTEPKGFSGDIVDITALSTDAKYMYEMWQGISTGVLKGDLALKAAGKMSHSRWLTTANRVLRLYVVNNEPFQNVKMLTKFIVKVYAMCWFEIKCQWSCKDGARHLFRIIGKSRYLPEEITKVIDPVIERNGFFGHPENLLIAILWDNRKHMRELALRRILKYRSTAEIEDVRIFRAVERSVKLVTEASIAVYCPEARDEFIRD
ncbi:unnamed protein product [Psylliodes chrysocephalus]|uniref:Uncharacterized protein n=1 Tax=Psylliodes chrysocephalus TaxID=3402493 RepID=A0A9P0GMZ9_9CUCU|nr:unnamed protein product [Psylliodes chrysocephala]